MCILDLSRWHNLTTGVIFCGQKIRPSDDLIGKLVGGVSFVESISPQSLDQILVIEIEMRKDYETSRGKGFDEFSPA